MPIGMGRGLGRAMMFGEGYRSNSPTLAYKAVYKKNPDQFISGMSFSKKKDWNGIPVDAGIKDEWLNAINGIKGIEIRSTEEGKDAVRVPHVAFRMSSPNDDKYAKKIVAILNKKRGIHAITDIGMQGRPRIMVAGKNWKSKDIKKWNDWWSSVAGHIEKAVKDSVGHTKAAGLMVLAREIINDSRPSTEKHINRVRALIEDAIDNLRERAKNHDRSKLSDIEKPYFDKYTPMLKGLVYGSPKYKEIVNKMEVAIKHHHANNRHHPEYFKNGINDMDLFDLLEMVLDWKASTERYKDGDITKSIRQNAKRFNISPQLSRIISNTVDNGERKKT